MPRAYVRPAVRAITLILCSLLGMGLAVWLPPSPLVVLIVLTVGWGVVVLRSWGLPWLDRLQQRQQVLVYWYQGTGVDSICDFYCDFYCVPDRCALLQARCARAGQQREVRDL